MTLRDKLLATSRYHPAGRAIVMAPIERQQHGARIVFTEDGEQHAVKYYHPELLSECDWINALGVSLAHYGLTGQAGPPQ